MTTLRPLGPRVTLTALARMSTPRIKLSRASRENFTSFAAMVVSSGSIEFNAGLDGRASRLLAGGRRAACRRVAFDDSHHVALLHDEQLFTVELDFGPRPFAEQDAVAGLEVEGSELAAFVPATRTGGDHFAFLRLFLGGVRDDDAAFGLFLGLDAPDDDTIMH